MFSIAGDTKYRTFSSTRRYLAFPPMTCFPGAPVRCPPGRNAARVPIKQDSVKRAIDITLQAHLCNNPYCLV